MRLIDALKEEILKLGSAVPILADLAAQAIPQGEDAAFLRTERPLAARDAREAIESLKVLIALLETQTDEQSALVRQSVPQLAANDEPIG